MEGGWYLVFNETREFALSIEYGQPSINCHKIFKSLGFGFFTVGCCDNALTAILTGVYVAAC